MFFLYYCYSLSLWNSFSLIFFKKKESKPECSPFLKLRVGFNTSIFFFSCLWGKNCWHADFLARNIPFPINRSWNRPTEQSNNFSRKDAFLRPSRLCDKLTVCHRKILYGSYLSRNQRQSWEKKGNAWIHWCASEQWDAVHWNKNWEYCAIEQFQNVFGARYRSVCIVLNI